MNETIIYSAIIAGIGTIIWFFIRRMITKSDKKFDILFKDSKDNNEKLTAKIDDLQGTMHDYAMILEGVKVDAGNMKETVGELKSDVKHIWKRFDFQKKEIDINKRAITFVEATQENCPARNKKK